MVAGDEPRFEREMACTPDEWLRVLGQAIGPHEWRREGDSAVVLIAQGSLRIAWRIGEPRQIALVRLPVLHATFEFEGVDTASRRAFMKRFDLFTHRGGG